MDGWMDGVKYGVRVRCGGMAGWMERSAEERVARYVFPYAFCLPRRYTVPHLANVHMLTGMDTHLSSYGYFGRIILQALIDALVSALLDLAGNGEGREKELVAAMVAQFPEEVKAQLPDDLLAQLQSESTYFTDVSVVRSGGGESGSRGGGGADTLPSTSTSTGTSTSTSTTDTNRGNARITVSSPSSSSSSRPAAELDRLRVVVGQLGSDLGKLAENQDPNKDKMLRVNVRDALRTLTSTLEMLGDETRGTQDVGAALAIREAEELAREVGKGGF
jgi:hypothetical protein